MCAPVGSMSSMPLENGDKARKDFLKTNESFIVTPYFKGSGKRTKLNKTYTLLSQCNMNFGLFMWILIHVTGNTQTFLMKKNQTQTCPKCKQMLILLGLGFK
jgi:hypothetical protein